MRPLPSVLFVVLSLLDRQTESTDVLVMAAILNFHDVHCIHDFHDVNDIHGFHDKSAVNFYETYFLRLLLLTVL